MPAENTISALQYLNELGTSPLKTGGDKTALDIKELLLNRFGATRNQSVRDSAGDTAIGGSGLGGLAGGLAGMRYGRPGVLLGSGMGAVTGGTIGGIGQHLINDSNAEPEGVVEKLLQLIGARKGDRNDAGQVGGAAVGGPLGGIAGLGAGAMLGRKHKVGVRKGLAGTAIGALIGHALGTGAGAVVGAGADELGSAAKTANDPTSAQIQAFNTGVLSILDTA